MDNPTPISGGEIAAGGGSTTTSPAPSHPASPPPAPADAPSTQAGNPPASGSWFDQLPEELKGSKSLAKFKDVNNLAQAYVHAESLIGRDKIPVPKTDEDWQDVYNRLGRPATPDDYSLNADALKQMQLPEDIVSVLEEDLKWFKPTAHNLGLNARQATALMQAFVANVSETMSSRTMDQDTELKQCENMLRKEYGQAYDSKITIAPRALFTLGGEKLVDEVNKTSLGRNPAFVNMFVRLVNRCMKSSVWISVDNRIPLQILILRFRNCSVIRPSSIRLTPSISLLLTGSAFCLNVGIPMGRELPIE